MLGSYRLSPWMTLHETSASHANTPRAASFADVTTMSPTIEASSTPPSLVTPRALEERVRSLRLSNTSRIHTSKEALNLVRDCELHEWLRKRQKATAPARPRTYMTRHRKAVLQRVFDSIDRDGSGQIDQSELTFALKQIGLPAQHVDAIFAEGDTDNDGFITQHEFFALVAVVNARLQRPAPPDSSHTSATTAATTSSSTCSQSGCHSKQHKDVAGTLNQLVDRAGSFPIGILANAQTISNLGACAATNRVT